MPRSTDPSQLRAYLAAGWQLIPLHRHDHREEHRGKARERGKSPLHSNWITRLYDSAEQVGHLEAGGNVGVRLRSEDLVVDVDPRNRGEAGLRKLCGDLGLDQEDFPTVETGGGGLHLYMRKPADVPVRDSLESYPGVEFKSRGRQVVAAGSLHPNGRPYRWDPMCMVALSDAPAAPAALLDAIRRPPAAEAAGGGEHTREEVAAMLDRLDPEDFRDHDAWLTLMQACHHASGGDARSEFVEWSTRDPMYSDHGGLIGRRWDSLRADAAGSRVTCRTLYKVLRDSGAGDAIPKVTAQKDFEGEELDDDDLRCTEAPGKPEPEIEFRKWVFVADAMCFVRGLDCKQLKPDQFNALFAHLKPEVGSLLQFVYKGKAGIRKFERLVYEPGRPEVVGSSSYNIWRPSGIAARPGDTAVIERHLELLLPDEVERGYLMDFLSLIARVPVVKLQFSLVLQGKQGTGKTAIARLMQRIIGTENVVVPSNDEVQERFTKWQEGAQLAVIEELMGAGKRELVNKMKPVITNDELRIEEKGRTPYSIPNRMNLMCFTNHKNALAIETGDRRWLVMFSPMEPQGQAYYDRLFEFIESEHGPAAFRHLLETREVGLNPKGRAPRTEAKEDMRLRNLTDVEAAVHEAFEQGAWPFDADLVRLEEVAASLPNDIRVNGYMNREVRKALDGIGAVQHTRATNQVDGMKAFQLYSVRDHSKWENMGPTGRQRAYNKMCRRRRREAEDEDQLEE